MNVADYKSRRIRPAEVCTAYHKIGAYPATGVFYEVEEISISLSDEDKTETRVTACGLGAVAIAELGLENIPRRNDTMETHNWDNIHVQLHLDEVYVEGYVDGFDEGYDKQQLSDLKPHLDEDQIDADKVWIRWFGRVDGAECRAAAEAAFTAPK